MPNNTSATSQDTRKRAAFPQTTDFGIETGLTKREHAAIQIAAGYAALGANFATIASKAVELADELFQELEK